MFAWCEQCIEGKVKSFLQQTRQTDFASLARRAARPATRSPPLPRAGPDAAGAARPAPPPEQLAAAAAWPASRPFTPPEQLHASATHAAGAARPRVLALLSPSHCLYEPPLLPCSRRTSSTSAASASARGPPAVALSFRFDIPIL